MQYWVFLLQASICMLLEAVYDAVYVMKVASALRCVIGWMCGIPLSILAGRRMGLVLLQSRWLFEITRSASRVVPSTGRQSL